MHKEIESRHPSFSVLSIKGYEYPISSKDLLLPFFLQAFDSTWTSY